MVQVLIKPLTGVNFAPQNEYEEIIQNVQTILSTYQGSVPLNRGFGVNATLVDNPINSVQAEIVSQYMLAIKRYEPRVEIERIEFKDLGDGKLSPIVEVRIIET